MTPDKFNIRVYGLVLKEQKVLLVRETLRNFSFVKFPGGGVEKGEGILDGLKREMMEELKTEILEHRHFYTTDFFQVSAFNPAEQIVSVYYRVLLKEYPSEGYIHTEPGHRMEFIWKPLDLLVMDDVTFPIDRHVVGMLLSEE